MSQTVDMQQTYGAERRKTPNEEVCDEFRALLTTGFFLTDEDGVILQPGTPEADKALTETKPWRAALWKQFMEMERRLCPVRAFERARP